MSSLIVKPIRKKMPMNDTTGRIKVSVCGEGTACSRFSASGLMEGQLF